MKLLNYCLVTFFLKGLTIKLHKYGVTFMLCSVMTCPTLNLGHKHENCYVVKLIL